ncbi:GGDEF domain-containing protein [Blastococcus sp. SYSU DS0541]
MSDMTPQRIAGRGRLLAALGLLPLAVEVARRRGQSRRVVAPRQRQAPLRLPLPAGLAVLSVLQLRHTRRVEQLVSELTHRSRTDALTGLGNRWAFDEELAARLRSSRTPALRRRCDPAHTTLALIDIDHFKAYNDRHGHPAGDQALAQVAEATRRAARNGDGVYRVGGEEFAVLLDAGHGESLRVADRIRLAVADARAGRITVSVGVATTAGGEAPETLIARADLALYRAKERGRNCVDSHRTGPAPAEHRYPATA